MPPISQGDTIPFFRSAPAFGRLCIRGCTSLHCTALHSTPLHFHTLCSFSIPTLAVQLAGRGEIARNVRITLRPLLTPTGFLLFGSCTTLPRTVVQASSNLLTTLLHRGTAELLLCSNILIRPLYTFSVTTRRPPREPLLVLLPMPG